MRKYSARSVLLAVTATLAVALPATAQAGGRHHDCFDRMFRDVDRAMTRVVHHTDRVVTHLFRWCDRRK